MDKTGVVEAIRAQLREEYDGLTQMTAMSRDEATGGESKAENKYDTRALEASYLAAGQGQRLEELKHLLAWYEAFDPSRTSHRVADGALVETLSETGRSQWYFVAPAGGSRIERSGQRVQTISLKSPLGRALSGLERDDAATVESPQGTIELEIITVR